MRRYLIVIFTIVLASVFTGCIDLKSNEECEAKVAKLEAKVDSLQNVITGKKSTRTKVASKTSDKKAPQVASNKTSANLTAIIEDVEEYLAASETAKAFENRGKDVSAKEFYAKAEKYEKRVSKLFAKDAIITLDFTMKKSLTQNYMFEEEGWKLRTHYYTSVKPDGKPKEWLTSDKEASRMESLIKGQKYRVKFKVLDTIAMPYGGSVSYFTLHVKYLDIRPIE